MTFRRFVRRNRLDRGDYGDPGDHAVGVNLESVSPITGEDQREHFLPLWTQRLVRYENEFKALLGDLRRLEQDALDERAIVSLIVRRTGLDSDAVAAVLQEFLAL